MILDKIVIIASICGKIMVNTGDSKMHENEVE